MPFCFIFLFEVSYEKWYVVACRNKKSVSVDLQQQRGREIIYELVKHCDILVENFLPGM